LTEFEDKILKENISEIKKNIQHFKYETSNLKNSKIVKKIMENKTLTKEEMESNYYMNYHEIKNFLIINSNELNNFYLKLRTVIVSELIVEEDIDEHILFAQINSTGKKLSAFDLVKNYLFSGFYNIDEIDEIEKYIDDKLVL
jgi:uncharacterized protein with ParB-like and HNH nuclease domain